MMDTNRDSTHLTSEDRRIIESGVRHGSTKTAIAKTVGKDNSTIGKEIKLHRKLKHPTCQVASVYRLHNFQSEVEFNPVQRLKR